MKALATASRSPTCLVVAIPNPHGTDIGVDLLSRILRQAGVTRAEWERA
jgi:hypothetical protein